jgi:hypothetical protein
MTTPSSSSTPPQSSPSDAIASRPTTDDANAWKAHWQAQGMPWRTEPEISVKRQTYLAERRAITPYIEQGVYPFTGVEPKLTRADIEWLLATHQSMGAIGPVDWEREKGKPEADRREGLDLRGADLSSEDLSELPLDRTQGGLASNEIGGDTETQRRAASARLSNANLRGARLSGATLSRADLEEANLRNARLEEADLRFAHLERADIREAHLEGVDLTGAHLGAADLRGVFFDPSSLLNGVSLGQRRSHFALLENVRWGGANLSVIDWSREARLGNEPPWRGARNAEHFEAAGRACDQLAAALRAQGLEGPANRFSYFARSVERRALFRRFRVFAWLASSLQDIAWGYGYRPSRAVVLYILAVSSFALAYYMVGLSEGESFDVLGALVLSMTSFHGRGFFPGVAGPHVVSSSDPIAVLAACEAFVGLVIEAFFIAALTRRRG